MAYSDAPSTILKTDGKFDGNKDAVGLTIEAGGVVALTASDSNKKGELKTLGGELSLVVNSARAARDFLNNKQWNLLWRDADLLFQAPRPMTVYEGTYVLEPNVQRFTVAKIVNAVVPQLYKGLFYNDPPMVMRPHKGVTQEVINAKTALFSFLLDECRFKVQTKWGMETMAHLGTGIWKWGIDWKEIVTEKRTASLFKTKYDISGAESADESTTDAAPDIREFKKSIALPFFEHRPLDKVLVDPKLSLSDVRESDWVVDVQYMDFYQMDELQKSLKKAAELNPEAMDGWTFPADLKAIWSNNPVSSTDSSLENSTYMKGAVHHAQELNTPPPDPLRVKLELLEYWDRNRKILVLNSSKVLFTGKNPLNAVPFLSSNWWNRPKSFYGMGLGLIIGQNQRVDQGTINAILKILSYGVNPIYLKKRDGNNFTQFIRTNIGKVMTVDGEPEKAFHLMETPVVPKDIWSALKESEQATESSSGADQQLVQGSTAGPRSGMGRTSGGATIQANASATRMDGPLDNFIEQVFKPFLGILDHLVFKFMSDAALVHILGKTAGKVLVDKFKAQDYWDAHVDFEVLAGSSMAAKRTMAQSMVMLTQILDNPQIQESLAEINEEYIDFKPIIAMWMEASEWKNGEDIIKPMTAAMKQKRAANSKAAIMQQQLQAKQQDSQQKFQQKQQMEDQQSNDRIKRDLVIASAKANGLSQTVEGAPSTGGLQGMMPTVA
jgi:hypothetical protein